MGATFSRIVTDRLGNEVMIIHPDRDSQLQDPAFQATGTQQQYDVPYRGWTSPREFLVLLQQKVASAGRSVLANLVQARVDLLDDIEQARADASALADLNARFPNPTQGQQIAINLAAAKLANSAQAMQDKRDAIAAFIAQLP